MEQRRQLLAFDVELDDANAKVRRLEAQVLDLEKQVNPLQKEVTQLKKRAEEQATQAARAEKLAGFKAAKSEKKHDEKYQLGENELMILKSLARLKYRDGTPPSTADVAKVLKIGPVKAGYMLREMKKEKLIYSDFEGDWHINTEGEDASRSYIALCLWGQEREQRHRLVRDWIAMSAAIS